MRSCLTLFQTPLLAVSVTLLTAELEQCGDLFNIGRRGWGDGSWIDFEVLQKDLCSYVQAAPSNQLFTSTVNGQDGSVSVTLQAGDSSLHRWEAVEDTTHNCFDSDKTQTSPNQAGTNSKQEFWSSNDGCLG